MLMKYASRKKGFLIIAFVIVLALGMVACSNSSTDGSASSADASSGAASSADASTSDTSADAGSSAAEEGAWPAFDDTIYIGVALRSMSNPYHVQVSEAANLLAEDLKADGYNVEVSTLLCEGSDEAQISDMQALIARGGENTVFYVDPNNAPNTTPIAEMCKDAGAYWTSVWNIADGDYPMDYNPSWVAHCSPDDTVAGYEIAVALFESFETPGKGKILALEGMLGNTASSNRTAGLKKALEEYPDVELLDMQPTDWDMQISLDITETWLSKYDDFDGIWTSGDPMGLGAITALTKAGLNGKVGVTGVNGTQEAIDAVKAGDMTATWDVNGYMQGYYATAWAVAAKLGVIDPASEPVSDRMFYTPGMLVTSDNVDSAGKAPEMNYKDFKSFNLGEMANEYQG